MGRIGPTEWTQVLGDATDYGILEGVDGPDGADWVSRGGLVDGWIGGRGGLVDGRIGAQGGLRNPERADWRTGRTTDSWIGRTGADGANRVDWSGRGGLGKTRRTRRRERIGSSLEERKERTGKPVAGVPADWADRLGCTRLGQLASSRLRAEGIPGVLSPDADCGVIWLHTPRIHIRFFGAHIVVIFLGTHTSKAQRPSTSDKFFGSLGALNITYSMFIQMEYAMCNVVIVTYKRGLSSLVPPSSLCTSCCS